MTRSLAAVLLLGVALGALACNPYSREDLLFAMVAPSSDEMHVAPPGTEAANDDESADGTSQTSQAMEAACGATNLRCHAVDIARNFNVLTTSVLNIVDNVLGYPPTFRQSADGYTRRVWGPVRIENGATIRVEMLRTPDDLYVICMHGAPGALAERPSPDEFNCESDPADFGLTTLINGVFAPGAIEGGRARNGKGGILFHADAFAATDPGLAALGKVLVSYDNTGQERFVGVNVSGSEALAIDSDYLFYQDRDTGAGRFYYALRHDFTPGPLGIGIQREQLFSSAQWTAERAGRVDTTISGGDLGNASYAAIHCWDADFTDTYYVDTGNEHPTVGEEGACEFGPPPEPVIPVIFE